MLRATLVRWRARTHPRCAGLGHMCRRRSRAHMTWDRSAHVSLNRSASADVVMLGVSWHSVPRRSCVLTWRCTGRRLPTMLRTHAMLGPAMLPWPSNTVLSGSPVLHPPDTMLGASSTRLSVLRSVLGTAYAVGRTTWKRAASAVWASA